VIFLDKIARCHRGRHFGDVAHLAGEIVGHQVHVVGEILPRARDARHLRLSAELALGAHFAGHAGHFGCEAVELIDHHVDGVLQLEDLALHVDGDLLGKIARCHGGGHFGDVAHLAGEIVGHQVDVVGEILPRAGDAFHPRLPAQFAFGADFARHARHFRRERIELVHHRVDGVLELEDLALHFDGDLLGQVARCHCGGHFGDVAHLARQVGRHRVDVVGEVLPRAGDALHARLPAQFALGAHFARHARHFGRERGELLDHGVHHLADAQEFAAQRAAVDLDGHRLREVALGHRADDARDFGGRLDHVLDQLVDRAELGFPAAGGAADMAALGDLAFLADDARQPLEFVGHRLFDGDDFVEQCGYLAVSAREIVRQADREVTPPEVAERSDELTAIERVAG
jgi:hypothetical protein